VRPVRNLGQPEWEERLIAWLRLIQRVPQRKAGLVQPMVDETEELIRILAASLRTASQRRRDPGKVER
jgi:hypothetical protein